MDQSIFGIGFEEVVLKSRETKKEVLISRGER